MQRTRPAGRMIPYPQSVTDAEEAAWQAYEAVVRPSFNEYRAAMKAGDVVYEQLEQQAVAAQQAIVAPAQERYQSIETAAREAYQAAVQAGITIARIEGDDR